MAFISQSGATAVTRMSAAAGDGIGFHCFVGLDNRVDIDENELMSYLAAQPEVKSLALYLESSARVVGGVLRQLGMVAPPKEPVQLGRRLRQSS